MGDVRADRPTAGDGEREYHLHTRAGDIAPFCLLVGSPERAEMIASTLLENAECVGDHRGLKSYTGTLDGRRVSVITTGMGGPSIGIVLPEAYRSGGRVFIRVGSCSTLFRDPKPGDVIVVPAACRFDGASVNWAPIQYPAVANWRVTQALVEAARGLSEQKSTRYFVGVEATTDDFNEGQARENIVGYIPPAMQARHEELIHLGVGCYSMEASALFTWCSTHRGTPSGAVNAIYGNRRTNEFSVSGEDAAATIALDALIALSTDAHFVDMYLRGEPFEV